ncbi:MAG: polysaccharide pyruvyl transferase family protein [Roseivirga sp.]|uniref:polysaccharide pyruvyl transferase family protein n=1 Tax=Roseivirga sp. TaxID=1964215 RepID=UPI001B1EAC24|nr:polysaccharide pyruvyl transferase family protein [Roseivirga sp.]MBO6497711.1 polysaccharide pyruvyl transferase family protein [Roseivirga sp.]
MKVLITHVSNTLNYGSAMMAINTIYGLRRSVKNIEIYCECDNFHLERLQKATNESIKSFDLSFAPQKFINKFTNYIWGSRHPYVYKVVSNFDAIIVLGGDDLSEVYQRSAILKSILFYHMDRLGTKVILAGQNVGPYYGIYRYIASVTLKNIIITVRDNRSFKFLSNYIKPKEYIETRDLAFNDLPNQDEASIPKVIAEDDRDYIVVVPSGLIKKYDLSPEEAISFYIKLITRLSLRFPNSKLVLLAHVLLPEKVSDGVLIDRIAKGLDINDLVCFSDEMMPSEARAILGGARFVISGRMHAAVSSLYMGTPVIALAYSEKYFGVIGDTFELHEFIMDCRNGRLKSEKEVDEIMRMVEFLIDNFTSIEGRIESKLGVCKKMAQEHISFISKFLKA